MLDTSLYVSFLLVSTVVILIPGPNIFLILATSITRGRIAGVRVVFGVSAAMIFQLFVAAAGMAWLAEALSDAFSIVRWLGVGYFIYLSISNLREAIAERAPVSESGRNGRESFWRGVLVALINPKTILFFGALLPQFATAAKPIPMQIALLSMSFLLLATTINLILAFGAGSMQHLMERRRIRQWIHGAAGALFIGAGVGLAFARRA